MNVFLTTQERPAAAKVTEVGDVTGSYKKKRFMIDRGIGG
jgi:hypothetical protein